MSEKKNVLILCTGNSCRSQMAEGWGKSIWNDKLNFYSAGIKKHGLNPYAVKVMHESGIDISEHYSKTLDELKNVHFDLVITVCDHAKETCPILPSTTTLHRSFEDPPFITKDMENDEEKLPAYRKVRDEIQSFISNLDTHSF